MARPLDGSGKAALIFQAGACKAAREDLALLIDELQEEVCVFVINVLDACLFETAVFFCPDGLL